ncbi:MAG: hypothetical protein MMC23_005685 [Stictis urceolatum]|nr:hypothetical protein [Stictis urceolata]
MPRHGRAPFSASSVLVSSAAQTTYLPSSNHNSHYGLLDPSPITISSSSSTSSSPTRQSQHLYGDPCRPRTCPSISARRHHRKSSSLASVGLPSVNVPAWSEVEAGIDSLRDKSIELGAGIGEQICDRVPVVRGSVAFLSTLRSNLQLSTSLAPPSPYLHPISPLPQKQAPTAYPATITMPSPPTRPSARASSRPTSRSSSPSKPSPPASAPSQNNPDDPLQGIPPLTYAPATTPAAKTTALRLIADSLAQKRQSASYALLTSPATLGLLIALFGAAYQVSYTSRSDWPLVLTTCAGLAMCMLAGVRMLVGEYLALAEGIGFEWLGTDEAIYARFGEEVIGAAVLRVESEKRGKKGKVGVIRAWTVRRRERGRGVGRGMLEMIVERCVRERGCSDVRFAREGEGEGLAGEGRVLPGWVEGVAGVEERERRGRERAGVVLAEVVRGFGWGKRR